jgi:hypothetical protein
MARFKTLDTSIEVAQIHKPRKPKKDVETPKPTASETLQLDICRYLKKQADFCNDKGLTHDMLALYSLAETGDANTHDEDSYASLKKSRLASIADAMTKLRADGDGERSANQSLRGKRTAEPQRRTPEQRVGALRQPERAARRSPA